MKKQFIGNLAFLQILNLLVKPVWILLVDLEVQNVLGNEFYGRYFIHLNLAVLFIIILDIGVQTFNTRSVSGDPGFFVRNFKKFILLKSGLALIYFLVLTTVGLSRNLDLMWLWALGLNQVLSGFVLYFRSNLAGLGRYKTDSILSVADKLISTIICVLFILPFVGNHAIANNYVFSKHELIKWFIIAQNAGMGIALFFAVFLNLKERKQLLISHNDTVESLSIESSDTAHSILVLVKKSLPYALLIALMSLYTRIDATMIASLSNMPEFEAGIYAQSFRLLDAAAMFAMLFSGLLLPMFGTLLKNNEDVRPIASLAGKLLLAGSVTVALCALFYGEGILRWLYDNQDVSVLIYSSQIFTWVIASFIPMCMIYVFGTLLTAKGDIKYLNKFAMTSLVANIVLNFILIPRYNALGAAIATLITQGIFGILCVVRCFRAFHFEIDPKLILRMFGFILGLTGTYFLSSSFPLLLSMALFFAVAAVLTIALRIFSLKLPEGLPFKKDSFTKD